MQVLAKITSQHRVRHNRTTRVPDPNKEREKETWKHDRPKHLAQVLEYTDDETDVLRVNSTGCAFAPLLRAAAPKLDTRGNGVTRSMPVTPKAVPLSSTAKSCGIGGSGFSREARARALASLRAALTASRSASLRESAEGVRGRAFPPKRIDDTKLIRRRTVPPRLEREAVDRRFGMGRGRGRARIWSCRPEDMKLARLTPTTSGLGFVERSFLGVYGV
jgi:hypothetical protein